MRQDRFGEALVLFNQALEKAREEEDGANPLIESAILKGIGLVHAYERRFSAALGSFDEALALSHEIGDSVGEASLLASRAHVLDDLGRIEEALSAYESAMTLLESVRSLAGGEEERSGFIAQHQDIYQHAVDLYYRQGLYDEAFYLAERARLDPFSI